MPDLRKKYPEFPIFLFGSRSMAERPATQYFDPQKEIKPFIYPSTDWDFIMPNHTTWKKALRDDGYEEKELDKSPYPWSKGVDSIFVRYRENDNTQVLIRNDYEVFIRLWWKIDPKFWHDWLWKRGPNKPNRMLRHDVIEQMMDLEKKC